MFALYDQDKDGYISRFLNYLIFAFSVLLSLKYLNRDEMVEVVASVFDLMGKTADPQSEEEFVHQRVDIMFKVCIFFTNFHQERSE